MCARLAPAPPSHQARASALVCRRCQLCRCRFHHWCNIRESKRGEVVLQARQGSLGGEAEGGGGIPAGQWWLYPLRGASGCHCALDDGASPTMGLHLCVARGPFARLTGHRERTRKRQPLPHYANRKHHLTSTAGQWDQCARPLRHPSATPFLSPALQKPPRSPPTWTSREVNQSVSSKSNHIWRSKGLRILSRCQMLQCSRDNNGCVKKEE